MKFRKIYALLILLGLFSAKSYGQALSVTATLTDSDGTLWVNGTCSAQLVSPNGSPFYNGSPVSTTPVSCAVNSSGVLSGTFQNTNTITPSGAFYQVTIGSNTSAPATNFNTPVTTANMTSVFSAALVSPRFAASPTARGYADVEVSSIPPPGGSYYNVTNQVTRQWNGTTWLNANAQGTVPALQGTILAAYDLTRAVSGQAIQDYTGDPTKAIPWPSSNAPTVITQGLLYNGSNSACLNVPSTITGAVGVSVYYSQPGENYAGGVKNSYPAAHTLFSGDNPPSHDAFAFVRFSSGQQLYGGNLYNPEVDSDGSFTSSSEAVVGTHLWTYIASNSNDLLGFDDHFVAAYTGRASLLSLLVSPYYIGCAGTLSANARPALGTLAYVVIWGAAPTATQLAADYISISNGLLSKGLNNNWGAPAADLAPQLVAIGDSHADTAASGGSPFSGTYMPLVTGSPSFKVLATSGKFLPDMVSELSYEFFKNASVFSPSRVVFLEGGANNFANGSMPAVNMENYYVQAAGVAHASGLKYIQQTFFSLCNGSGVEYTIKNTLNAWIRANWKNFADGIADVAASKTIGQDGACTNLTNFDSSQFHLTATGKTVEGLTLQAAYNNILGSTATTPTTIVATSTLVSGQNYVNSTCGSACAITLPDATINSGSTFCTHVVGAGTVTLTAGGSDTIDGNASISLATGTTGCVTSVPNSSTSTAGALWFRKQ